MEGKILPQNVIEVGKKKEPVIQKIKEFCVFWLLSVYPDLQIGYSSKLNLQFSIFMVVML